MNVKNSNYIRFIDEALELAKTIPRYFSRFSNKIFCNQQKIVLLVLKQKLNVSYRDLIEFLKISGDISLMIGLKRIPHHTTLVKFAKKISSSLLVLLLPFRKAKTVAVDATGFELDKKSYYYRKITQDIFNNRRKTRRFMKLSIVADMDKQLILKFKIRRDYKKCNLEFRSMLKDLNFDYVIADKGYDSYANRNFVIRKLKSIPIIPVRRYSNYYGSHNNGRKIDGKNYHQRSKVETIFSVIKRKYGSYLKARTFNSQVKELILKLVAYNAERLSKLTYLIFEGFSRADKRYILKLKIK